MTILVTGATGYIGGRLVPELLDAGHDVRVTTRDGESPDTWWADQVQTVQLDMLQPEQVRPAVQGVDVVYYLVHGMGGRDFPTTDREAAEAMRDAVEAAGVGRVIYLSGLIPDVPDDELSAHLASRLEVERILGESSASVLSLRAAVVLGAGSTSFEIIRQLSKRLPVHTIPGWMDSSVQPIALVDTIAALVGALDGPETTRSYDIGGPDYLQYSELLALYTDVAGLFRVQVPAPPLTPTTVVGILAGQLTDLPTVTVESLVGSLRHDMVAREDDFLRDLLPAGHRLVPAREAIERSLAAPGLDPAISDPQAPSPDDAAWAGEGSTGSPVARLLDGAMTLSDHTIGRIGRALFS